MRREPCLLPVRRATKSTEGSYSPSALPSSHFALAALLAQGADCGTPHGWEKIPNQASRHTACSYTFPPLTFPHSLAGLRSLALFRHGFHVLRWREVALKAAPTSEASLLHTQDPQPGMVGDNPATPLQQGAQIPQPGHAALSLHLPYHPPQHLQNPMSKTEDHAAN